MHTSLSLAPREVELGRIRVRALASSFKMRKTRRVLVDMAQGVRRRVVGQRPRHSACRAQSRKLVTDRRHTHITRRRLRLRNRGGRTRTNPEARHLAPQFHFHRAARLRLPPPIKGRGSHRGRHFVHEERNCKKNRAEHTAPAPTGSPDLLTLPALKTHSPRKTECPAHGGGESEVRRGRKI